MARGAGANIRTLLIGGCVFGAGYGSGQVIAPASAEPSLPTLSVPVPTVSVPVPTVSVPVPTDTVPLPPTVPTLPTSSAPPPTISVPTPVGPRPPVPAEVRAYEEWHRRRLDVAPGLTGLWQVSGRSDVPFDEMVLMDLWYIEHWSPGLDVKILLRTIPAVLSGRGAS